MMFSCFLILVRNSQISTLPCNQPIIKINKWGEQEDFSMVDLLEENHPTWWTCWEEWTFPREDSSACSCGERGPGTFDWGWTEHRGLRHCQEGGGTHIFLRQPVATREGSHFCYNQLLPDFAETAALAILLLPSASFVENLTGKLGWTM